MSEATTSALPARGAVHTHWPKGAPFPVRKPNLAFDSVTPRWFKNNPILTRHMDTLSSLFPDGERFFVEAVRAYQKDVKDPALAREIRAFIGQEARHSEQHTHYNAGAGEVVEWSRRRCERLVKWGRKRLSKRLQLAATVCAEHFTATLGEHLLRREDIHQTFAEPNMQRMWLWHAVEENEHKTTAFAVFKEQGYAEWLRILAMPPTTLALLYLIVPAHIEMVRRDGHLGDWRSWAQGLQTMLGPNGFYTRAVRDYLDWYRPGFKPEDHDTQALLAQWKRELGFDESDGVGGLH